MVILVWAIILGLIQTAGIQDVNFLVLLAILAGLRKGPLTGLFIGTIIGVFTEVLSASISGLNVALFAIIGFLSGIISSHIYYKENMFIQFLCAFFGVLSFYFMYFIITKTYHPAAFSIALFSAFVSPLVFRIVPHPTV